MSRRAIVLVDATTLRTSGGLRGMGRMGFDLLHGLAETRAEWSSDLDVRALTHFDLRRGWVIRDNLADAADESLAARNTVKGKLPHLRRALLGSATRAVHASLLHLIDPDGTPWLRPPALVTTCHDLVPLRFATRYVGPTRFHRQRRWLVDRRRYGQATRVAAISRRTRDDLVELLDVSASRIDVIPNGVDLRRWQTGDDLDDRRRRARLGVGPEPYVFFAGHCDYKKNLSGMIAALAQARRQVDVRLVLAGDLTPGMAAKMHVEARKHAVDGAVTILGYVDDADLPALYRGARALLFLSHLEGFGLPVAEAMAAGCPVIVARGSGSDEVGGDAALVVPANDAAAAAEAIRRLTVDPIARRERIEAGWIRSAIFDRRTMARAYVRSYRHALGQS